jgi:hypothetical protein
VTVLCNCYGRTPSLVVGQDSHLQRVTIPEAAYDDLLMMGGLRSKHVEKFNLM